MKMKGKILIGLSAALLASAAGVWFFGGGDATAANIPREIPVEDPGQKKNILELAARAIELYNKDQGKTLSRAFDCPPHERLLAKAENGEDPVETGLAVLRRRGDKLRLIDPEVKTWHIGGAGLYFVDCRLTEDSGPVRLLFVRKSGRVFLNSIQEI